MLHFGFKTTLDLLSWIVVFTLGSKILATVTVLAVDKTARDRPGWGSKLWWLTKLTPLIAVPCLLAIAVLERDDQLVQLFLALGGFVLVAVPLSIWQRHRRISRYRSAKT